MYVHEVGVLLRVRAEVRREGEGRAKGNRGREGLGHTMPAGPGPFGIPGGKAFP